MIAGTKYDDGFASLQQKKELAWWSSFVNEEQHKNCVELSGKLVLLFHIVKLAEQLGDKVWVSLVIKQIKRHINDYDILYLFYIIIVLLYAF